MKVKQKVTGRAASVPAGIGWGVAVGMGITLVGAAVLAWMMSGEKLSGDALGYGIMIVLVIASGAGALTAAGKIKRLRVQMCLLTGGFYYLGLLSVTALFFGGKFQGMGITAVLVIIGCALAALMGLKSQNGTKPKIKKGGYR